MGIAHIPFHLRSGHQRRYAVDNNHVHGATSDQVLGYLQRLLRGIRLRDEEFCQINPKVAGVGSVHRVLGIDIGSSPTRLLGLRHDVLSQCGLAGGLGAEDLRDSSSGHTANAQRHVQREGPSGDSLHCQVLGGFSQPHYAAFAHLTLYLAQGQIQSFFLFCHHTILR